jgi:hypothetical protein
LAYSNTFHAPFQWDEMDYIVNNPIIKDMSFFTDTSKASGLMGYSALKSRYIGYLTFALNYKLHGVNVFGYHVVNLVIHLVNAVLVYFSCLLTFRRRISKGLEKIEGIRDRESKSIHLQDSRSFTSHYSWSPDYVFRLYRPFFLLPILSRQRL